MKPQTKRPLLFALLFLCAGPLAAQWNSIQLPCMAPYVYNLQISQGTVYAYNGNDGVYKSTDQGLNWQFAFSARSFAINPYNDRFYRFTVGNYGVEMSADQGQTWNWLAENPFLNQGGTPFLTFSGDTEYLYGNQSLYRVTAQGLYLIPSAIQVNYSQCFVRGQHVWVSSYFAALHSADGGITWDTIVANGPDNYNGMSMAATGDTILINYFDDVDSNYVITRTTDQGLHWSNTTVPFNGAIEGDRPFQAYDFYTRKTYYSWNGLTDWQLLDIVPIPNAIAATNAGLIVGLQSGVYYGPNGQWQKASFEPGPQCSSPQFEVYLRKTAGFLLFGSEYGGSGMATYGDGGNAWSTNDEPYFAERPVQIGNHLIGCGAYGTYRAALGLLTFEWELINPQGGFLIAMNGLLYVCDPADNAIYRSSDEGQTWIKTGDLPEIEPSSNGFNTVFGGTDGRLFLRVRKNLLVSEDEGLTWTVRNTFPTFQGGDVSRLFAVNGFVLLSYVLDRQIFFSSDYGVTFSLLPAPTSTQLGAYRLRVHENTLLLYIGDDKLYRSTDWGQTWTTVKPPYPGFNFDAAVAGNTSTVYGDQMYLFDPALGVVWTANPDNLGYTPCDNISINMPTAQCNTYINVSVFGAAGNLNYAWFKDGIVVQQNDYYYPDFMGQTGSTYTLRITDIDGGCTISDSVRIVPEPVAVIKDKSPFLCSQQLDTLDFSGSSNYQGVRYSLNIYDGDVVYSNYFNINGVPVNPNPPAVAPGYYLFWVYDEVAGCSAADTIFVQYDANLTIASIDLDNASCGQSDGSATVHNTDPAAATYNWSTGGVQPVETGLAPGWHSVTVTNGFCAEHRNFLIKEDSACSVKIRGRVYNDTSTPDCLPGGAYGASGVMLRLLPDDIYSYTDAQGYYEFSRPAGNYSVELAEPLPTELLCPVSGSYQLSLPILGDFSNNNDFYFKTKPVQDIGVSVTAQAAVPGSAQQFVFTIWNHSNVDLANVLLAFKHGEGLTDLNPSYLFPQYDPASQTGISDAYYLPAGYSQTTYFTMQVPADIPVGTVLHYSMDIFPNAGDVAPENNHVEWSQTVVATQGGNEKTVSPGETEHGGKIFEKDSLLHYTLRFQNNGNYEATTVEIRDTLDENLDVTSIQVENSTGSYHLKTGFEGHNVLVFTFEDISLNYSAANEAESRGYVAFSIKRKPGLPFGTVIRNRAAVSFDYNKPLITNIVESVLSEPVSIKPDISARTDISIYPNPNTGVFMVELAQAAEPNATFRIIDLIGRLMLEQKIETGREKQTIQTTQLPAGLYFLQLVYTGGVVAQKKFVKL